MMIDHNKDRQEMIHKSPNSIDQLLSKELMQLSMKDRTVITEEIHGVSTLAPNQKESRDFLEASLKELSIELDKIPDDSPIKAAYLESQVLLDTYVNGSDFRLRFLRRELFDTKKAAIRMMNFLNFAQDLFGPVVLQRPIRMNDLSKEEKKWMENFQLLPYRDRSGRLVLTLVGDFELDKGDFVPRFRVTLYVFYCMADDIETQQKGCVYLTWNESEKMVMPQWEYFRYCKKLLESSPVRQCSMHFCTPKSPSSLPIAYTQGLSFALGKILSRVKFHNGDKVELLYKLKSYGIPVEFIPVTETGNIKTNYLKQWMRGRNHLEKAAAQGSPDKHSIILSPRSTDVLFRTGTCLNCHPGNAMFESIIEEKLKEHSSASQTEKVGIVRAIIRTVGQNEGGRFLMWDKRGWWEEIKDASKIYARTAERMRRVTNKQLVKQQMSRSSTVVFQNQDNGKRRKLSFSQEDLNGSLSSASGCWSCFL